MEIKKILVIGAGQMGSGIALTLARYGHDVLIQDIKEEFVDKGLKGIQKIYLKDVEKGRMTEEAATQAFKRVCGVTELTSVTCNVDLVIEAASENEEIKFNIFRKLDELCPAHTILASNTSSIPITSIGGVTKRPEKVVGIHFFNPVPVMKLVEVISGQLTSTETTDLAVALAEKLE